MLHLATHGFFLADQAAAPDGDAQRPLTLAGVALAGANRDEELLEYLVDYGFPQAADRWAQIAAERGDTEIVTRLADEGSDVAASLIGRSAL